MSTSEELTTPAGEMNNLAKQTIRAVSDELSDQANVLRDATAAARYNTENFIQTNPWTATAMAVGFGFLIGVIVARR
jgi:ElaB/YqjD/DUF883 family membrane-anchored ribosome-binding protein